jgi:hypothetical protein
MAPQPEGLPVMGYQGWRKVEPEDSAAIVSVADRGNLFA